MLSVEVEDKLVETIDEVVAKSGKFSSRSEFLKDSIRRNLEKQVEVEENMKKFMAGILELRKKAYANGYDGRFPTREERAKIANDYFKEQGIDIKKYLK